MKCSKCQFENRGAVKYCEKCGAKIELVCPNCGAKIPLDRQFCGECGHNLTLPLEPPTKELSFDEKLDKIQRYLPKGLTEKILSQRGKIEGERKQVTVMFCDMEGFTALSERLGPEEAYSIMDEVYEILIHKVHDYEGTVNEMTGDGIMALFGAPIALEDAPQRAIRSAMAIHREISKFSDGIKQEREGMPPLKMRIGIHTGPVVVGTLGNDLRVEFKAVGDTVNLASRMEGLAEPGTTYITKETYRLTGGYFEFKPLGELQVKGKEKPVEAYRVLGLGPAKSRLEAAEARGLIKFVGRRRELENLAECFGRAKAGQGQVVGIVGESGIGKSRLVLEFRKSIDAQDLTYLEGQCPSFGQSMPYLPFIEIIKKYFEVEEGDRALAIREKIRNKIEDFDSALTKAIPFLCDVLSVPSDDPALQQIGPEEKRNFTFEAVKAFFLRETQVRPLVIALDNLQWVDRTSQEFMNYLVEGIANARILILGIYRPGYVHLWSDKSYYSHIALNPLSEKESATLAQVLLDVEEVSADLRSLVLDRAEGNPLYVEEIVHWLLESGAITRSEVGYVLKETSAEMAVPDSIQEVIMARIDRLEQDLKKTMQIASVIGRDFLYRLLTRISGVGKELQSYLAKLQSLEFIYEKSLFPELEYMFKHILIQDVAYHSLLVKTRKQLHDRIGNAVEELYKDRLDEHYEKLAYHYQQSGNRKKAVEYLVLAAKKAADQFATEEAMAFCEEGLKILDQLPATEENQKLRRDIEFLQLGLKAISDERVPM
jgi:class 3 adenylate cyclase/ABC-type dipeptide/oligopeptide/nickel transport system ATPase component